MIVYNMLLEAIETCSATKEEKQEIKTYLFAYEYACKEIVMKTLDQVVEGDKRTNELISYKIGQTGNNR